MAATLVFNKLAAILGIKIAKTLPVLKYTRQQASDKVFESDNGANGVTMLYALPDYGIVGDLYKVVPMIIEEWDNFSTAL